MRQIISYTLVLTLTVSFAVGSAQAKLVACVGDSITFGSGRYDSYPAQLGRMLKDFDDQWETRNFGVSGATLLRNGDRPYVQQNEYTQALTSNPDVVIIMLGTNDSKPQNWEYKDDFISDYLFLIDSFAQLSSNLEIWICKPVPVFSELGGITDTIVQNEIVPLIDEIAQQRDVQVIDLFTALSGASDLFPDGVHPNAQGAELIAKAIVHAIIGIRAMPDFNGDARINFRDFTFLAHHWLQNEPSPDIAPAFNGDGIVDYKDLVILVQYWLREFGFIAHWKLDEAEGNIAHDSANGYNGTVHGDPTWQLDGGQVDGALQLDGIDDYISTAFVLNPSRRPFSVFAWIKGGAPGQVVIAQKDTEHWLYFDPLEGKLKTDLKSTGRMAAPMTSQTVITTDEWNHIGFVWDGSRRMLYVGNTLVAEGPQDSLMSSNEGLYIGTGKQLESGTFFSGLIDDVRIYNRAITP